MGPGKELSDKMSIGRIIFFVIVYILGLFILTIFMFSERLNFSLEFSRPFWRI